MPEPDDPLAIWFERIRTTGGIMLTLRADGPKIYAMINGARVPKPIAETLIREGYLEAQRDELLPGDPPQPQTWRPRRFSNGW